MNPANVGHGLFIAQSQIPDPGASGTIVPDVSLGICNLVSATAESRTLGRPVTQGVIATLYMKTDGGDITLTVTGGFDQDGTTSYTFSATGQFLMLQSLYDGTNYYWRKVADYASANASATFTNATVTNQLTTSNQSLSGTQTMANNANFATNATTGSMFATNNSQKVGFWGATPIIQPSGTGEVVGMVGNASNVICATNMTSNGNVGTKAYSMNDIVKALKNEGLLAPS